MREREGGGSERGRREEEKDNERTKFVTNENVENHEERWGKLKLMEQMNAG